MLARSNAKTVSMKKTVGCEPSPDSGRCRVLETAACVIFKGVRRPAPYSVTPPRLPSERVSWAVLAGARVGLQKHLA